jgi:hypothetical protein
MCFMYVPSGKLKKYSSRVEVEAAIEHRRCIQSGENFRKTAVYQKVSVGDKIQFDFLETDQRA